MGGTVIYTAISGNGRDTLLDPIPIHGINYVCFTDQPLKSNVWDIMEFKFLHENQIIKAKHPKILPHEYFKQYDLSIWIDGNICPNENVILKCNEFLMMENISLHKHPRRDCIYKEAFRVNQVKKCSFGILNKQLHSYRTSGMPLNNGLWECGVIFRRHNEPSVVEAMELWWNEIIKYNQPRDQISFAYVVWKMGLKLYTINDNIRKVLYVKYVPHEEKTFDGSKLIERRKRYVA